MEHFMHAIEERFLVDGFMFIFISLIYLYNVKNGLNYLDKTILYIITVYSLFLNSFLWLFNYDIGWFSFHSGGGYVVGGEYVSVFYYVSLVAFLKLLFYSDKTVKGKI